MPFFFFFFFYCGIKLQTSCFDYYCKSEAPCRSGIQITKGNLGIRHLHKKEPLAVFPVHSEEAFMYLYPVNSREIFRNSFSFKNEIVTELLISFDLLLFMGMWTSRQAESAVYPTVFPSFLSRWGKCWNTDQKIGCPHLKQAETTAGCI